MISFDISITVEEKQFRFAADLLSDTTAILPVFSNDLVVNLI